MTTCDAVVIGAGHNGLVAANLLADAGWDVVVVEASAHAGGAVRSAEVTAPGFVTDLFSSYYPMTAASPVIAALHLEDHGLRWSHSPTVLAHLRPDAPAAVLHRDAGRTAAGLEADHRGDGAAWLELAAEWDRYGPQMMAALLAPFPPVRAAVRLAAAARLDAWDLVRRAVLPVRSMATELFGGEQAALLLAGNALHADVTPEAAPSALLGWMLVGLGQTVGFPVPAGGSSAIIDALLARLAGAGGAVRLGTPVERVLVEGGRAVGVRTADGAIVARHAVLAACDAQLLYGRLVDRDDLPDAFVARMRQFQRAGGTVKVNYALSEPVAWSDERANGAGTVHVADSVDELSTTAAELAVGLVPAKPFLLVGQTTTADPTRSPAGTESLWMYTHVPQEPHGDAAGEIDATGRLRGAALDQFVERMEDRIVAHAPGFRSTVVARHVQGPDDLERENASLVGGDISGGTTQLHQQLVFRPVPGLARSETPVTGLYLASSSAHPGGSVHGACGANAARAALAAPTRPDGGTGRRGRRARSGDDRPRRTFEGRPVTTVLVTGANSGIGAAATSALLEEGADVVATVRTRAAASVVHRANPSDRVTVKLLDVTDAATSERVVDEVRPDVVVNAAGDALLGAMVDATDDDVRAQFETLVIAPVRLARLAAVHQRERGGGRIVNVSSSTADSSLPFTGWYAAAKSALDAATDALRIELGPSGIDVVRVELGAVRTPAWDDAGDAVEAGDDPTSRRARHRWAVLTRLARPAFGDPDDVGDVIARAALAPHPRRVYRSGFGARMGLVSALTPDMVEDAVKRRVFGLDLPPAPS